jgi:hypothetical protein
MKFCVLYAHCIAVPHLLLHSHTQLIYLRQNFLKYKPLAGGRMERKKKRVREKKNQNKTNFIKHLSQVCKQHTHSQGSLTHTNSYLNASQLVQELIKNTSKSHSSCSLLYFFYCFIASKSIEIYYHVLQMCMFSCVQRMDTVYLTRRRYDTNCWETFTKTVASSCDCMWSETKYASTG